MPALLDPKPEEFSADEMFGNKIFSTLYIKFKHGFFPRGVFCCLVALCMQKIESWKLQFNAAFKNLIIFQINNNKEYLVLSDKLNYISIEVHRKEKLLQNNHQALCCMLFKQLKEVCKRIHLDEEFMIGFLCENCQSSKTFALVQLQQPCCPESLLCDACHNNPRMTYDQLVWFVPPKVSDVLNVKVSKHVQLYIDT